MRGEREKDNRTRDMVLNYVRSHPGSSVPEMMRVLQVPEGTLRYHLDYLARSERIDSGIRGSKRCYYPAELSGSGPFPGIDPTNLSKEQVRILDAVKRNPGIGRSDLSEITNVAGGSLSRNLKKLKGTGLIWQIKNGGEPGYEYITDEGLRREMLKLLVMRLLEGQIDEDAFIFLKDQIINAND